MGRPSVRPTSLRQQLTRAAMLTTFFAILLSAGALLTYELTVYRHAVVADMRAQADLITRSTAAAVEFKDPKVAWENLYLLKQQPRIVAAAVYGPDGALIASHTTQPDAVSARISVNEAAWGPRYSGAMLEMTQPIEREGQRLGMLYLKSRHGAASRTSP